MLFLAYLAKIKEEPALEKTKAGDNRTPSILYLRGIIAVEAGEAEVAGIALQTAYRLLQIVHFQVTQVVGADHFQNLKGGHGGRRQLVAVRGINAVMARKTDWR